MEELTRLPLLQRHVALVQVNPLVSQRGCLSRSSCLGSAEGRRLLTWLCVCTSLPVSCKRMATRQRRLWVQRHSRRRIRRGCHRAKRIAMKSGDVPLTAAEPEATEAAEEEEESSPIHLWYHGASQELLELYVGCEVVLTPQIVLPASLASSVSSEQSMRWSFIVNANLPKGLEFNSSTGVMSGAPRELSYSNIYLITAQLLEDSTTSTDNDPDDEEEGAGGNARLQAQTSLKIQVALGCGDLQRVVGTGVPGPSASGLGHEQQLSEPLSLCAHRGKLYIGQDASIAELNVDTGNLEVLLGRPGELANEGNGRPKDFARVGKVAAMVVIDEELYFADSLHHVVRKVGLPDSSAPGVVQAVAGNGKLETTGDGGGARDAGLPRPSGLASSPDGKQLYVASADGNCVRCIDIAKGTISTLAGTGEYGFSGDGGDARQARLSYPNSLVQADGILYVADTYNRRVRCIDLQQHPHIIRTRCAGGFEMQLGNPRGLALGPHGFLYVASDDSVVAFDLHGRKTTPLKNTGFGEYDDLANASIIPPLDLVYGVAVLDDMLYICDWADHKVHRVRTFGHMEQQIGLQHLLSPWQAVGANVDASVAALLAIPNGQLPCTLAASAQQYVSPPCPSMEDRSQMCIKFTVTFLLASLPSPAALVIGVATAPSVQRLLPQGDSEANAFIGCAFKLQLQNHGAKECNISFHMPSEQNGIASGVQMILDDVNTVVGEVRCSTTMGDGCEYALHNLTLNGVVVQLDPDRTAVVGRDVPMHTFAASLEEGVHIGIPVDQPPEVKII